MKSYFDTYPWLRFDTWLHIVLFLNARDVCKLQLTAKIFNNYDIYEVLFQKLIEMRWREDSRILKIIGTPSWKTAYGILSRKKRMPQGLFTKKQNSIVFGHGRRCGCEGWIMVSHQPNTRLRVYGSYRVLTFQLCFQNISNDIVNLNLNTLGMSIRTCHGVTQISSQIKLVAKNGMRYINHRSNLSSNDHVKLRQYEFIVISFDAPIQDDDSIVYEAEYLSMARSLQFYIHVPSSDALCTKLTFDGVMGIVDSQLIPGISQLFVCTFYDEMDIWDHYVELPGGVVLLRRDCESATVTS